jgi:hypothetical protein
MLKERADYVTQADHGAGVRELIDRLIEDDLVSLEPRLTRHHILLGGDENNGEVRLPPYDASVLIAGTSGSGKSTVATGLMERLADCGYQFCIIDPEGDYSTFEHAVVLGNNQQAPSADEVLQLLQKPGENVVVNLLALTLTDRPSFFLALLPRLQELRARTGRPHWLLVDETHHLLPTPWEPAPQALPLALDRMVYVTVHPDQVSPAVLSGVTTAITLGESPDKTLSSFCAAAGLDPPKRVPSTLEPGEMLAWVVADGEPPSRLRIEPSRTERRRHRRKYAEGELPPERSFFFHGRDGKLNLRAQNLVLFMQLADGVDDETWLYHLRQGDYSRWFREGIKDEVLSADAARIEALGILTPHESRERIKAAIQEHYTLPVAAPKCL